eukprot:Platyproteum_vivax@DN4508_c0_g1_i1.p1
MDSWQRLAKLQIALEKDTISDPAVKKVVELDFDGVLGDNYYKGKIKRNEAGIWQLDGVGCYWWGHGANCVAFYRGNLKENIIDVRGQVIERQGISYNGEFKNGQRHGYGSLSQKCDTERTELWDDADSELEVNSDCEEIEYVGEWKDGKPHGHGRCEWRQGENLKVYDGDWCGGLRHGVGTMAFNGSTYTGEWELGNMHGHGKGTWSQNGLEESYEGSWIMNAISGGSRCVKQGYYDKLGGVYMWHQQKRKSRLLTHLKEHNSYWGEFYNNMRWGEGVSFYGNLNIFHGVWEANKRLVPLNTRTVRNTESVGPHATEAEKVTLRYADSLRRLYWLCTANNEDDSSLMTLKQLWMLAANLGVLSPWGTVADLNQIVWQCLDDDKLAVVGRVTQGPQRKSKKSPSRVHKTDKADTEEETDETGDGIRSNQRHGTAEATSYEAWEKYETERHAERHDTLRQSPQRKRVNYQDSASGSAYVPAPPKYRYYSTLYNYPKTVENYSETAQTPKQLQDKPSSGKVGAGTKVLFGWGDAEGIVGERSVLDIGGKSPLDILGAPVNIHDANMRVPLSIWPKICLKMAQLWWKRQEGRRVSSLPPSQTLNTFFTTLAAIDGDSFNDMFEFHPKVEQALTSLMPHIRAMMIRPLSSSLDVRATCVLNRIDCSRSMNTVRRKLQEIGFVSDVEKDVDLLFVPLSKPKFRQILSAPYMPMPNSPPLGSQPSVWTMEGLHVTEWEVARLFVCWSMIQRDSDVESSVVFLKEVIQPLLMDYNQTSNETGDRGM